MRYRAKFKLKSCATSREVVHYRARYSFIAIVGISSGRMRRHRIVEGRVVDRRYGAGDSAGGTSGALEAPLVRRSRSRYASAMAAAAHERPIIYMGRRPPTERVRSFGPNIRRSP
jgi:hypothetical protein